MLSCGKPTFRIETVNFKAPPTPFEKGFFCIKIILKSNFTPPNISIELIMIQMNQHE